MKTTAQEMQPKTRLPRKNNQKLEELLSGWLMASPAIVLMLGFLIIPLLLAVVFSFTDQRLISPNPTNFVGTRNFERLLGIQVLLLDPIVDEVNGQPVLDGEGKYTYPKLRDYTRNPNYPQYAGLQELTSWNIGKTRWVLLVSDVVFVKSLFNTLLFTVVVVPIQSGLALLLALLINRRTRGITVFRTIYFMPLVVSMVVVSILWAFIYDGQNGLLNSLLGWITGGNFKPLDWMGNTATVMPALIAMSIWQSVGFHMIIWLAGLQEIPKELYEAAEVDGANELQKFLSVTWPGLRNTAVFIFVTITIAAFGLFTQVYVMTQGGPLDSTSSVIFYAVIKGFRQQDIGYGSAISVVFFVLVLAVALIQRYLTKDRVA
jgi:multiple sugar transport system permease protein